MTHQSTKRAVSGKNSCSQILSRKTTARRVSHARQTPPSTEVGAIDKGG